MFGDGTVDLIKQFPVLVSACEWATGLAKGPAVGANLSISVSRIYFSTRSFVILTNKNQRLLVTFWANSRRSIVVQSLQTGILHGRFLPCSNPSNIHKNMRDDPGFQKGFSRFFEDDIE